MQSARGLTGYRSKVFYNLPSYPGPGMLRGVKVRGVASPQHLLHMSSLLFRLPQELRDQVYEYALYETPGLLYRSSEEGADKFYRRTMTHPRRTLINWLHRHWPFSRPVERAQGPENNQLKYVCRRLYYETKGMDLRCNWIVFRDCASLSAVQQSILLFRRYSLPDTWKDAGKTD